MKKDTLKVENRVHIGKNGVKKVRKNHQIPGVLYGHHIDNVNIQVNEQAFEQFTKKHGTGASLTLDLDGNQTHVLFKDMQFDPMLNKTKHVEFQALSKGEKIKLRVPIHFTGKDNITTGMIFQELHHEVEMQVLPKDLIESITVDLSTVQIGDTFAIKDLDIFTNESFEILEDRDTLIYSIGEASVHVETEETEEPEMTAAEVPEVGQEE